MYETFRKIAMKQAIMDVGVRETVLNFVTFSTFRNGSPFPGVCLERHLTYMYKCPALDYKSKH